MSLWKEVIATEWSKANQYSSFNSMKGLTYFENYRKIMAWMRRETDELPPPVEVNLDPYAECNNRCYFCFDKDEKVTMADLSHKKISEITPGDKVLGKDVHGKLVSTTVVNTFDNGRLDWLYKLTLEDGDSIVCTQDHQFWKPDRSKWTEAKHLEVGHYVQKILMYGDARLHNLTTGREYKKGYVSGLACGDGCLRQPWNYDRKGNKTRKEHYLFSLAMNDKEAMDRFGAYCTDLGIRWHWGHHNCGKYVMDAVLVTDNANARRIKYLMERNTGLTFKIGWIAGMMDAEGSTSTGIRIHQKVGTPTYERLKSFAVDLGYDVKEERAGIRIHADLYGRINFLNKHRPALTRKAHALY